MRLSSILACAAMAPLLVAADEPVRLQPSSPWVVDYAENSCRLERTFGAGADETTLILESVGPGSVTMTAVGRPLKAYAGAKVATEILPVGIGPFQGTAQQSTKFQPAVMWTFIPVIAFDPHRPPKLLSELTEELTQPRATRPPPIDLAQRSAALAARQAMLAKATSLEVAPQGHTPVIFETGPLDAPVKAFDQCDRDLIRDVGLDPDVEAQVVRPVWTPNIFKWVNAGTYPPQALNLGQDSRVSARLLVDATGKVTKCISLTPFNTPEFNEATCAALAKAHFEPAELANGQKVPSYYLLDVTFRVAG